MACQKMRDIFSEVIKTAGDAERCRWEPKEWPMFSDVENISRAAVNVNEIPCNGFFCQEVKMVEITSKLR